MVLTEIRIMERLVAFKAMVFRLAVGVLGVLVLNGCATSPAVQRDSSAEGLRQRAVLYWEARAAGDVIKAYGLESASVTGEQSLQAYAKRQGLIIRKAEVSGSPLVEGGAAKVPVSVEYVLPAVGMGGLPQQASFDDEWVLLDGIWFHKWRPPMKPGQKR